MAEGEGHTTLENYVNQIYKKIPESKLFQISGGFEIPAGVNLENLSTDKIFRRLCAISKHNVVALSEMGNGTDYTTTYNITENGFTLNEHIQNIDNDKGINDTCFVVGENIPATILATIPGITNKISLNGITFASIHFSGDGPDKDNQDIPTFLKSQLVISGINKDDNVKVLCGDTNITLSKCSKLTLELDEIGKHIAVGLSDHLGGSWLVIMSNCKVDKIRKGYMLINQQLKKSNIDSSKTPEEDGTIMAIKFNEETGKDPIETIGAELPANYRCYTSTKIIKGGERGLVKEIMNFSDGILDEKNQYIDPIFLDHSVIQVSSDVLNKLFGINEFSPNLFNLISLNMGSIVNSGKKNWNTRYIKYYEAIKEADKEMYNLLKGKNDSLLPEYDNIIGRDIVNTNVAYDLSLTYERAIIQKLMDTIKKQEGTMGGAVQTRNVKTKRRSRKYKGKSHRYRKKTNKRKKSNRRRR